MLRAIAAVTLVMGLGVCGAPPTAEEPRLVEAYPNSVAAGNEGEFVTVAFPSGVNSSAYALADETSRERLPATDAAGCRVVTFARTPALTRALTNRTVAPLPAGIRLADDGDRIELRRDGHTVDGLAYDRAPEGAVYNASADAWRSLGATDRPVLTANRSESELFVLPDEGGRARALLESAEERILLAGYTLTSRPVVEALLAAHDRGVRVRVLVEGEPVGGMSSRGADALDALDRGGIDVRVVGGDRARYEYHHPKYAVVDDRALVTTENWKPAGLGGAASRGWGVVFSDRSLVGGLAETFERDAGWRDAILWDEFDPTIAEAEPASGEYPTAFEAESVTVERTELVVAPDNAADRITDVIDRAEESLWVIQPTVSDRSMPFVQSLLAAAERGVEVRLLLSRAWYVEEDNRRLARWLDEQAERGDLPLTVRLAEPGGAFDRIHAKGIIADDSVVLGSVNWSNNSIKDNREVAVILHGAEPAAYFREVYAADWAGQSRSLPLGLVGAVALAAGLAIAFGRTIRFASGR